MVDETEFDIMDADHESRLMDRDPRRVSATQTARPTPTEFVMAIELHYPINAKRPCESCVLSAGLFMCMDRSYCQLNKDRSGKVWRKKPASV